MDPIEIYHKKIQSLTNCSYKPPKENIDMYYQEALKIYKDNCDYDKGNYPEPVIDTLIVLYKMTRQEKIFNLIYNSYRYLIKSIADKLYRKYNMDSDIFYDAYNEGANKFYKLILKYQLGQAPFCSYVKTNMYLWLADYYSRLHNKNEKEKRYCNTIGMGLRVLHRDAKCREYFGSPGNKSKRK